MSRTVLNLLVSNLHKRQTTCLDDPFLPKPREHAERKVKTSLQINNYLSHSVSVM